ncbi:hypothetical protein APS_2382 [Acetobacter pasteurianus subsp. pasteurianus LMG 1262 = NBRC 106471]|nr:hypothetical protein APS_2382 [Acetobacter pasteurianus subsp. pasteurianus LMG 1262 = NBRC 106471]
MSAHDRICLTNNAAERALRGIALGRKAWLFSGSDRAIAETVNQNAQSPKSEPRHINKQFFDPSTL